MHKTITTIHHTRTMPRIDTIRCTGLLPRVFVSEAIPPSEVWSADLTLHRGRSYLIEAASGGGKSSLVAFLYGLRDDYEGTVAFDGRDIRTFGVGEWQRLRREHLAWLPQELGLFPDLTAIDNILLKNALAEGVTLRTVETWMERLGIASRRDWPVGRLSIGQQQRVALIRSLCQPFDFIILDEPVSHLDERNNREAAAIIADEARRREAGIITTSVGNPLLLPDLTRIKL